MRRPAGQSPAGFSKDGYGSAAQHRVGDVLFKGSIGRTDLPGGNFEQLIRSITQNLWPLGDDMRFVPGHGETSTFGFERKTNPFVADAVLASG